MSFTEMITEHAAKSVIGGMVVGLLSGIALMWSRGMNNAAQITILDKDLQHRDEIREIERSATNARLTALETSVSALQTHLLTAQSQIMNKLEQIEKDLST